MPHIPNIIATGKYAPESPAHNHPDVDVVHTYRGTAQTSAGPKEAVVDVMERSNPQAGQQKYQVHSLNHEGSKTYEKRKRSQPLPQDSVGLNHARKKGPTQDSVAVVSKKINLDFPGVNPWPGEREKESASSRSTWADHAREKKPTQDSIAAVDENISPQFEVVNLRIEDVTVDEDTIAANVTARFREWLMAEREAGLARDAAPEERRPSHPGPFTGPFAGLNRIRRADGELPWA